MPKNEDIKREKKKASGKGLQEGANLRKEGRKHINKDNNSEMTKNK